MVRCVNCAEFHRRTRRCDYHSKLAGKEVNISKDDIHKDIACKGYWSKHKRKRPRKRKTQHKFLPEPLAFGIQKDHLFP